MSEILDNALDSLRMGLTHYLDPKLENRDKWAILELFHSVELLLKERLYQEHPLLIFRNVDKPIGDNAQTVGLQEILTRFVNIGVDISKDYIAILQDLQRRRNRIEHYRFAADSSHQQVLGEALKFIVYFLKDHLDEDIQDHLPEELFNKAKELIFDYDELISRAEKAMETALSRFSPKERSMIDVGTCSECGNRMVLIGVDEEPTCYFCDEPVSISQCQSCGEYLPPEELIGGGICRDCFDYKMSKD